MNLAFQNLFFDVYGMEKKIFRTCFFIRDRKEEIIELEKICE